MMEINKGAKDKEKAQNQQFMANHEPQSESQTQLADFWGSTLLKPGLPRDSLTKPVIKKPARRKALQK